MGVIDRWRKSSQAPVATNGTVAGRESDVVAEESAATGDRLAQGASPDAPAENAFNTERGSPSKEDGDGGRAPLGGRVMPTADSLGAAQPWPAGLTPAAAAAMVASANRLEADSSHPQATGSDSEPIWPAPRDTNKATGASRIGATHTAAGSAADGRVCLLAEADPVMNRHGISQADDASLASADGDRSVDQPLVIQADAPLVDGLRALLVHHLKRSVGSCVVNLSTSQAELLEHHLARLSSYAQKIVHTLAFATRFLSKHQFEGDPGDAENADGDGVGAPGAGGALFGGARAFSARANSVQSHAAAAAAAAAAGSDAAAAVAATAAKPPRKSLKLSDDEILMLYRSAQSEAAMEADWRGIQGPVPSRSGVNTGDAVFSSRNGASGYTSAAQGARIAGGLDGQADGSSSNRAEYLRILTRVMQEPGHSHRAVATEIVDPSKKTLCCGRTPALLDVIGVRSPSSTFEAVAGRANTRTL
mmetsp:Transcript_84925/g.236970  ORF Transcript_84925/g.236970 Transcript_84925/m.236970 type:complete len:477 (+) Transcript_84925:194-1624(+)